MTEAEKTRDGVRKPLLPIQIVDRIEESGGIYKGRTFHILNLPEWLQGVKEMQTAYVYNGEIDEAIKLWELMRVWRLVDKEILNQKWKEILMKISLTSDGFSISAREAFNYAKDLWVDIYSDLQLMKEVLAEWLKNNQSRSTNIRDFAHSKFPGRPMKINSPYNSLIALKVNPDQVWFQDHEWFKKEKGEWLKGIKAEWWKVIIVFPRDSIWDVHADCPAAHEALETNKVKIIDLSE